MANNKFDLFLENNKALKSVKGSFTIDDIVIKSNALTYTARNKKIDVDRINAALKVINNNTSIFSNFRGNNKLTTAITISFEDNMEESFKEIISIYNKLKKDFSTSEYLIIASQVIFNAKSRVDVDIAVKNTRVAYDYMKKYHRFLTGQEDIANAAIIATTSENLEATFREIEENYEYLRANKISSKNNIQSLSHILSLISLSSKEKCDAVLNMNSILKEKKAELKNEGLPILGIVAFICEDKAEFAEKLAKISNELRKHKGFGNFTLGSSVRNMISASLASMDYLDNLDQSVIDGLIANTNTIALNIAIQTAVMAASITAVSISSANSTC